MSGRRYHFFARRMGRDVRAWPMLALLFAVVLVGICCVLWFMREAMRNERMAVREKLAEAYRGQLSLVQQEAAKRWQSWIMQLDTPMPSAAWFAHVVEQKLADSVICFDADGRITYPRNARLPEQAESAAGDAMQEELRRLVKAGEEEKAIQFVIEKFADPGSNAMDSQGRQIAPNAELLALELLTGRDDQRFDQIAARLHQRVLDYAGSRMPSAQRTFVMKELSRLAPELRLPTLAAEELAARFLEVHPEPAREAILRTTELRDVWSVSSPSGSSLALLTTSNLRARLATTLAEPSLPAGVLVSAISPGEETDLDATLVTSSMGNHLPGWRLALSLKDRSFFDAAADQRVARYLFIGSTAIAAMSLFAVLVGRAFGEQFRVARLKNDLVANVSHELKTPLTAMRALVDTLLATKRMEETTTREYLQLIATENARLSRVIDNFLAFSRLDRGKFRFRFAHLSPETVVIATVAAFGERARSPGIAFETHVASALPAIDGDCDALVTVLLNLLDNAWKYSGEHKQITLRAEARGGSVRFMVEDNGAGMSVSESKAIFDRFHQTDSYLSRSTGGCGLGLSIVRSIVDAHGGIVSVVSEPGRGSTFTVQLPAVDTIPS